MIQTDDILDKPTSTKLTDKREFSSSYGHPYNHEKRVLLPPTIYLSDTSETIGTFNTGPQSSLT